MGGGANPFKGDKPYGRTCLHYAAIKGQEAAIQTVIASTPDQADAGQPRCVCVGGGRTDRRTDEPSAHAYMHARWEVEGGF